MRALLIGAATIGLVLVVAGGWLLVFALASPSAPADGGPASPDPAAVSLPTIPALHPLARHRWWKKQPSLLQFEAILSHITGHSQGVVILDPFGESGWVPPDIKYGRVRPGDLRDEIAVDVVTEHSPEIAHLKTPRINVILRLPDDERYSREQALRLLGSALDRLDSEGRRATAKRSWDDLMAGADEIRKRPPPPPPPTHGRR